MTARRRIVPVFVPHLGCENDCVFCNQRKISGSLNPATADTVREALKSIEPNNDTQLAFYGGSFLAIPALQQAELLQSGLSFLRSGAISSIRLSTRPDSIDAKKLRKLKDYGVTTIEIGAQSMSDEVLNASGRGHTAGDVENAAGLIKSAGFELIIQMMTGLPSSDANSDLRTAKKIAALGPDGVRIYPTVIIRDTRLFDLWQLGEYAEHTVENAVNICSKIVPIFETAGVPIIRIGLNPTDDLSLGEAVAGAYHPALGELVRSRIMLERARVLLEGVKQDSSVQISVRSGKTSQMAGQGRCNIQTLKCDFSLRELKIVESAEQSCDIRVQLIE